MVYNWKSSGMTLNCFNVFFQEVKCEDADLQNVIQTAVTKLYQAIAPVKPSMELCPAGAIPEGSQLKLEKK